MPTHPTNVDYAFSDAGEKPAPVVDRSEVDRGIPRQRRIASDALVEVSLTIVFGTAAIATAWEDWFYAPAGAAGGAAWFDWVHPRTGQAVRARIKGGDIGTLKPDTRAWSVRSQTRQVTYEFVRSTY